MSESFQWDPTVLDDDSNRVHVPERSRRYRMNMELQYRMEGHSETEVQKRLKEFDDYVATLPRLH